MNSRVESVIKAFYSLKYKLLYFAKGKLNLVGQAAFRKKCWIEVFVRVYIRYGPGKG